MMHISRKDDIGSQTHAYIVRFHKNDPVRSHRTFSDSVWGGKRKALKAAKAWRDVLCKELGRTTVTRNVYNPREKMNVNNRTGVSGVGFHRDVNDSGEYVYFYAQWRVGPSHRRKAERLCYSIEKYGYDKAFRKAVRKRCEMIGKPVPRGLKVPDL